MRIVSSKFWKLAVRAPATDRLRSTLLPRSRLNVGPPVQLWPLLSVTDANAAAMAVSRSAVGRQRVGNGLVHLDRGAVGHQRPCDCGVPLCRGFEGHQRIGDGLGHLSRGAVIGQLGVGVGLALVDGRHHSDGDFGSREVIGEGRGDGVVRLLGRVRIAAEAQGPVVVGELDAQGARCVEVADLVGAGQQVPGHVADPSGGVDQIGGASEGGDLRQDPVDGGLQGDLQVAEVPCRGEGPGVLDSENLRVVPVEAGVLEGLSGLVGRLRQVGQERSRDSLVHVGRGLPGGHVDGQLVHHGLQRIGGRHSSEGGVVGRGDAGVHRCCRRGPPRPAWICRRPGSAGRPGRTGWPWRPGQGQAGSIGRDEALRCGEVRGQSVEGEVRGCGQGGHLALQRCDGCGIGADVRGVLGGFRERRVGRQDGDALQLDDRWLRHAVVEDPAGEGGREKAHLL